MISTGIRQLRMAFAMAFGHPINPGNVCQLVRDALYTIEELGYPRDDVEVFLHGSLADPKARAELQSYNLQRTLRSLLRHSPYYQKHFASLPFGLNSLGHENIHQLPITRKADLQVHLLDFIATKAQLSIATHTSGTTGIPTELWLSRYENDLWSALMALSMVLHREFDIHGCLQINLSLSATALVQRYITCCQLTGTRAHVLGIVPVNKSLDTLLRSDALAPTMLTTYPSYLAELVVAAQKRGLKAHDFHLRYIYIGSEVLSSTLARAARETFGATLIEGYGSTETSPASGAICREGHLHTDVSTSFFEVIRLGAESFSEPAIPGEFGTLVVTPYYPYRTCMPLFRYDTRDVVRRLPDTPLSCELSHLPATSHIEGKAEHLIWFDGQPITTRSLVEAIEALPSQPWPARFHAHSTLKGIELQLPREILHGLTESDVLEHFRLAHLPVCTVHWVEPQFVQGLRKLRGDLVEPTFAENMVLSNI
jgi:phenylacetate-CoA ligase